LLSQVIVISLPRNITPARAIELQRVLSRRVVRSGSLGAVRHVCGIDVGFECGGRIACAAAVVLGFPGLNLEDFSLVKRKTRFAYIPGLLSFREVPVALEALRRLRIRPDLLLCDGQGIAHPRRFGLASHMGLAAGIPSIGVAKSLLVGTHGGLPRRRGAWAALRDRGETIGAALRTRAGVKPIYVSIGHRVSLASAIRFVLACAPRYRLPETTRWAHRLASGRGAPASVS
jgi:deoxyribonuclease V